MFVVYSKDACTYCDRAKALLKLRGLEFVDKPGRDVRAKFGASTYPVIVGPDNAVIGGYEALQDQLEEPILQKSLARFSAFPVEHADIYDLYKKAVAGFWTADELVLSQDATDFAEKLTDNERHFLKHVLAFFASSDGIVNENLLGNFSQEVQLAEARLFYAYQAFNEAEHSRAYGMLIDSLIKDPIERDQLFNAIFHVPAVQKKSAWAMKYLHRPTRRFAERLVAFLCVEGILFSGSFCAIFWMKHTHPGLMPGLSLSNQWISRDEALHCDHAALLYKKLRRALSQDQVEAIVKEAVENEIEFINDAVPCRLIGMNAELMTEYIKFVADRLLQDLGYSKAYSAKNPFPWMQTICLEGKTNFFESRVSEYQRAGVLETGGGAKFSLCDDF
jgi:ribonucleotide reductase beta subunit family protein with ferritin-like domain